MKNLKKLLAMLLVAVMLLSALPVVSMAEVTDQMTMYAVATAHLDTIWMWSYETVINEYIPKTFNQNFTLFEKYPDYVFNFEGARRYALMKEYYPEQYAQVQEYNEEGRWATAGAAWENGDVNAPSPEALIRNVLYGNLLFADDFGNEDRDTDIYLPDCFGFGAAMPTWMSHVNLNAFSTQKLTWGNTFPGEILPFQVGEWKGTSDQTVYVSIDNYAYNNSLNVGDLYVWDWATSRAKKNRDLYGWYGTTWYFGTGDTGGAPADSAVQKVQNAYSNNANSDIDIIFATSTQWIDEMTEEQKENLPDYDDEFLLREHGTGTYTSRTYGHRWNSRAELLGAAAENSASAAAYLGTEDYPRELFTEAWLRVISHQFHDDITGTSLSEEYLRSWNEYWISMNQFGDEIENAVSGVASLMDTTAQGIPVVVNNPVELARDDTVTAKVDMGEVVENVRVYDAEGNEVPSQILSKDGTVVEVLFKASVPSLGYSVYDVRKADAACDIDTDVSVNGTTMQNDKYMVTIDRYGDIFSIFDKELKQEMLANPIKLGLFDATETSWPAWELNINDYALKAPREFITDTARSISIVENGPARVAIQVVREYMNSEYTQTISLEAGSDIVKVDNTVDWWETRNTLKAVFDLSAGNNYATYDLGAGTYERPNNTQYQAEVPAQKWADITDASGKFGVSILSDSKNGWDKPADNIIRLTLIHTPQSGYSNHCQNEQDRGLNDFGFAIFAHAGKVGADTQVQAQLFTEPMTAYQTVAHEGALGSEYSFGSINKDNVIVRAIKEVEQGTGLDLPEGTTIVRFNEGTNTDTKDVEFTLGNGIAEAVPVWGSEESMTAEEIAASGAYKVEDGKLVFDIKANDIRAFAIKLADADVTGDATPSTAVALPYNVDAISPDSAKSDTDLNGEAFPAELIPDTITAAGVDFEINKGANGDDNMVIAEGQTVEIPAGNKLYLLATSLNGDKNVTFTVGDSAQTVFVADYDENVADGQMYNSRMTVDRFSKPIEMGFMSTHRHKNGANSAADSTYLFKIELDIPEGATTVTLPDDEDILIAAASVETVKYDGEIVTQMYDEFGTTDSVALGNNFFFGFEDDEVAGLKNTQGTGAGTSTAVSYQSGNSKDDAHTGEGSYKLTVAPTGTPNGGFAYAEMYKVNIPVVAGTKVSFWLKATNADALYINLDGYTGSGISLRDYPTQGTRNLKDQDGRLMHPEQHGKALVAEDTSKVIGEWKYYEYDFSALAGDKITDLIFAFDVGGTAGIPAGTTVAYIDDLYVGTDNDTYAQLASAVMLAGSTPNAERTYSAESLDAYKTALSVAKVMLDEGTASKEAADAAASALVKAYKGLEAKEEENVYDDSLFVNMDTDKDIYKVNEDITVEVRIPATATKFGLRNEAGKYLAYNVVSVSDEDDYGFVTVTATTKISTAGDRKITLVVWYDGSDAVFTDAYKKIGVTKIAVEGNDPVAVSSVKAPLVVTKSENFTITVETPTSASKIGIFDANTNKALGKVSEAYSDKDGVRVWTITLNVGSKGYRRFTVKAADGYGAWSNVDAPIAFTVK